MLKEVVLRSSDEYFFSGKKISVDVKTGFVYFVGLVKAICKSDHEGLNSTRFWKRLKPEISRQDYVFIKDELYLSPLAIKKLVNLNAVSCKKSWGVFKDDGLQYFLSDLGLKKKKKRRLEEEQEQPTPTSATHIVSPAAAGPSSVNKHQRRGTDEVSFESEEAWLSARAKLLNVREKNMNDRESVIQAREQTLQRREKECSELEEKLDAKEEELKELQARLAKQKKIASGPDVSQLLNQLSSLTHKFKEQVSRSRRNSSDDDEDERLRDSPTPDMSDNDEQRSPSPVPKDSPNPSSSKNTDEPAGNSKEADADGDDDNDGDQVNRRIRFSV